MAGCFQENNIFLQPLMVALISIKVLDLYQSIFFMAHIVQDALSFW